MSLADNQVQGFAVRLQKARQMRTPVEPFTREVPGMTVDDGYRVQRAVLKARTQGGERVVGWKVGLTSAATRAELALDEPVAGYIVGSTIHPDGAAIEMERLIAPGVEAEIGFILRDDLAGPGVTLNTALLAIEGAVGTLEIVDSRYRDWKFAGPDLAADNGGGAGLVMGSRVLALAELDLPLEGLVWEHGGRIAATATAAEVGGTPLTSVVWLANRLATWGMSLHQGDIVTAGSISTILRPRAGDSIRARFTHLGSVSARFV